MEDHFNKSVLNQWEACGALVWAGADRKLFEQLRTNFTGDRFSQGFSDPNPRVAR